MTLPHSTDAPALGTDEEVLVRVRDLVQAAYRRQLWLFLLDPDGRQLPELPRVDIPRRPDAHGPAFIAEMRLFAEELGAASVVVVYERPGPAALTSDDRAWLRLIAGAHSGPCSRSEPTVRGPLVAHGHGVRWVGAEDLDDPAPVPA